MTSSCRLFDVTLMTCTELSTFTLPIWTLSFYVPIDPCSWPPETSIAELEPSYKGGQRLLRLTSSNTAWLLVPYHELYIAKFRTGALRVQETVLAFLFPLIKKLQVAYWQLATHPKREAATRF